MRRFGMGVMPTVKVRVRSRFPRRGMGQDDWSGSLDLTGGSTFDPTQVYTPPAATIGTFNPLQTASGGVSLASILPTVLAATPSIETGAAQIIKANNTPGIAVSGVVGGQGTAVGTSTGSSSGLLLLLVAAGIAFAIFAGK